MRRILKSGAMRRRKKRRVHQPSTAILITFEGAGNVEVKVVKEGYEDFSATFTDTEIKSCGLTPRAIEIFMQPLIR